MNQSQLFGKFRNSDSTDKDKTPESALKKHFVFLEKSGVIKCFAALLSPKYMASSRICASDFKPPHRESYGVIGTPKDKFYQKKNIKTIWYPPYIKDSAAFPNFALVEVSCPAFT